MDVTFAANILKAARVSSGLSQDEIATLAGVSRDTIQKLEQDASSVRRGLYLRVIETLQAAGVQWLPATEAEGEGFRQNPPDAEFQAKLTLLRKK
ncbi:helix-turn-helix domain-containing protein [Aliihoeflea sp. 40Bstr573]|uniref:helix-turn-helix domain-containing protein n=1 Tax=Aliihoeflea sp. 40Bstr573 TaxID=2696467 RepID=UPI0020945637|nr:helix-turn-helix domain-containing protein [Aliihoeflea sp. 40Bstr573]MCO6386692.1 helix-turn-helix domain-containing protein [Aliihoeflea sp. 40Bstr573]